MIKIEGAAHAAWWTSTWRVIFRRETALIILFELSH